ncbi:MAG: cytochrome P450 [Actinobacteria bacterium]|nr:cytochrome P450 [Actinomycetota bacterium]
MTDVDVRPDNLDLVSGAFWGDRPDDALAWLRRNDPVHFDDATGVWSLTRYDDVRFASQHPELFSSAGGIRPDQNPVAMMIDMDDPEHLRRRRLVSRGFTPQRVRAQEAVVRSVVDDLIDQVCERGSCDFVMDVAAWIPLIMIAEALGFEEADRAMLLEWSDDVVCALGVKDPETIERAAVAAMSYAEYIVGVIADRRAQAGDDLISTLVHAEVDGDQLEESELIFETLLILLGGDETTRHVLTGGLYQLLHDRSNWEALLADRSLLPSAAERLSGGSDQFSTSQVPLAPAHALRQMQPGDALLLHATLPPAHVRTRPFFSQASLLARASTAGVAIPPSADSPPSITRWSRPLRPQPPPD